jgi:hypothetical protein
MSNCKIAKEEHKKQINVFYEIIKSASVNKKNITLILKNKQKINVQFGYNCGVYIKGCTVYISIPKYSEDADKTMDEQFLYIDLSKVIAIHTRGSSNVKQGVIKIE